MKVNSKFKILGLSPFLMVIAITVPHTLSAQKTKLDLVCGKKVNIAESYDYKFKNTIYYFDSYDCREAFKNNPNNFLEKKCTPDNNVIDLVCGAQVNVEESYDYKYAKRVHHFHSYACRETFKKNSDLYMKNICGPIAMKDSIK
jgi:YHS domain-containing protein